VEAHIGDNREAALAAHQTALARPANLALYTDGSGLDGGIGAAIYSEIGTRMIPTTHTVYAAGLVGIKLPSTKF
jgi:hypothetical protein